jgi:hypothetical protein
MIIFATLIVVSHMLDFHEPPLLAAAMMPASLLLAFLSAS